VTPPSGPLYGNSVVTVSGSSLGTQSLFYLPTNTLNRIFACSFFGLLPVPPFLSYSHIHIPGIGCVSLFTNCMQAPAQTSTRCCSAASRHKSSHSHPLKLWFAPPLQRRPAPSMSSQDPSPAEGPSERAPFRTRQLPAPAWLVPVRQAVCRTIRAG